MLRNSQLNPCFAEVIAPFILHHCSPESNFLVIEVFKVFWRCSVMYLESQMHSNFHSALYFESVWSCYLNLSVLNQTIWNMETHVNDIYQHDWKTVLFVKAFHKYFCYESGTLRNKLPSNFFSRGIAFLLQLPDIWNAELARLCFFYFWLTKRF